MLETGLKPWDLPYDDGTALTELFSETAGLTATSLALMHPSITGGNDGSSKKACNVGPRDSTEPAEDIARSCHEREHAELPNASPADRISTAPASAKQMLQSQNFLKLPPELRQEIYKHICTAILSDHSPAKHQYKERNAHLQPSLPISFASRTTTLPIIRGKPSYTFLWQSYVNVFTALQLLSHQFRAEFLPAWAECTLFSVQLTLPDPKPNSFIPDDRLHPSKIWTALRYFLKTCNTRYLGTGPCVRHFRASCIAQMETSVPFYEHAEKAMYFGRWISPFKNGGNSLGRRLTQSFERLDADLAHAEMSVGVVIVIARPRTWCGCPGDCGVVLAKQLVLLRQNVLKNENPREHGIAAIAATSGALSLTEDLGRCTASPSKDGQRSKERALNEWTCTRQEPLLFLPRIRCAQHGHWTSHRMWQTEADMDILAKAKWLSNGRDAWVGFADCEEWKRNLAKAFPSKKIGVGVETRCTHICRPRMRPAGDSSFFGSYEPCCYFEQRSFSAELG